MRRKRHHRKTSDVNPAEGPDMQKKVITSHTNHIQSTEGLFQSGKIVNVIPQPKSPEEVHKESNKMIHSYFISTEESSNLYCPETLQPLTNDTCELFLYCKDEGLSPEQQKFHVDEWMNYVKFAANVKDLPYVSAIQEPNIGDQPSKNVASPELPVLVYSNSAASTPSLEPLVPSSTILNAPIVLKDPATVTLPLIVNNVPVTQCNVPSVVPNQTPIFPVKLVKNILKDVDKNNPELSNQEEILPFVLQEDGSSSSLLNRIQDSSLKAKSSEQIVNNGTHSAPSPASQNSDSNDNCISPELLCSMEVNFEEDDNDVVQIDKDSPASFSADGALDNSNGPKIIDVISGDAVANEFFKDTLSDQPTENDTQSSANPSGNKVVYSTEASMPKTVTQFSIFSMQKTIAVISSGAVDPNVHNLLGIRSRIPPIVNDIDFSTKLKNKLREEKFMTLAPWWMLKKRFLPMNPPCIACKGRSFRLNSCYEYLDSLCWTCVNNNCRKKYLLKRPKFFDRFPSFSLEELLLLTYHWACKSRSWVISKDVPVHEERIWNYFIALQELCGNYVKRCGHLGKTPKVPVTVEVSAVKLGKFFILCAYDRNNRVSRFQALTTEEACSSIRHIRVLQHWLGKECTLITWKKISEDFLNGITKVGAEPTIGNINSTGRHILNASRYLGKTMVQLFQNINHDQLTIDTLQSILDEVQWRERVGKTEESAFWSIMHEISRLNDSYVYTDACLGEISKDRFFFKADLSFRLRWGPCDPGTVAPTYISDIADEAKQITTTATTVSTNASPVMMLSKEFHTNETVPRKKSLHPISVLGTIGPKTMTLQKEADAVSSLELLSIKVTFADGVISAKEYSYGLGLKLVREGYLSHPVRWLVNQRYIKDKTSCYVCHGKAILVDNSKFPDGVSWLCQRSHCRFENRFKRPTFFAHFGFKMDVIFATIFHWAVQSDYKTTVNSICLNEFNILSIHRRLQRICAEVAEKDNFKIGGNRSLVEVAFVRFANCFILGAMERDTSLSRFRTFSIETKLHIDEIRKTLISWLHPTSTVVVNSNKYLGRYCMEERINLVFADKTVTDVKSKKYHTLTITNYLQSHIKSLFRNIKTHHMRADLMQVYLDELIWRERHRRSLSSTFEIIMRDIFSVEYGASLYRLNSPETILKKAAAYYGFSLPLPQIRIPLQRLPDHVVKSYTNSGVDIDEDTDDDEVTIIENVEVPKKINVEIILDDDDDEEVVENKETVVLKKETGELNKELKKLLENKETVELDKETVELYEETVGLDKETVELDKDTVDLDKDTVDLDKDTVDLDKDTVDLNEITVEINKESVATADVPKKNLETVTLSPNLQIRLAPSSSTSSHNDDTEHYFLSEKHPAPGSRADYRVIVNKRHSDKSYSRKRKDIEENWKLQCVECRDFVTIDHFVKPYHCSDCKYNIYTTYCQKAFARHRAYILFGRKIPESSRNSRKVLLPDVWHCVCGFSSLEGNELASHLIQCNKTTCYLNTLKSSSIL